MARPSMVLFVLTSISAGAVRSEENVSVASEGIGTNTGQETRSFIGQGIGNKTDQATSTNASKGAVTDTDKVPPLDYFDIIGVPKTSTPAEIKKAYKSAALKLHPDQNKRENATERFQELGEAKAAYEGKLEAEAADDPMAYSNEGAPMRRAAKASTPYDVHQQHERTCSAMSSQTVFKTYTELTTEVATWSKSEKKEGKKFWMKWQVRVAVEPFPLEQNNPKCRPKCAPMAMSPGDCELVTIRVSPSFIKRLLRNPPLTFKVVFRSSLFFQVAYKVPEGEKVTFHEHVKYF